MSDNVWDLIAWGERSVMKTSLKGHEWDSELTLWGIFVVFVAESLSRVQLFATLWTVAHQALRSMGFPRQEYWSGLPFPSPGDLPKLGIKPVSPTAPAGGRWIGRWILYYWAYWEAPGKVHEFISSSLSSIQSLSRVRLFATPWIAAYKASLSITKYRSSLKPMCIESVMPSSHVILCRHPSPPAPNPSQHQSLFQWVNSSHEVAKVLEFKLYDQSFQWTPRTDLL